MDEYQAGYQAGVADHGEHHRCGRCYAAGQAELQARVAALTAALEEVRRYTGDKPAIRDFIDRALDAAGGAVRP